MKKLVDILEGITVLNSVELLEMNISDLAIDSREVREGGLFIAYKGYSTDGHEYIKSAIDNGAKAVVLDNQDYMISDGVQYILVEDSKKISAKLASNYFDHPSQKMKVIGITGTNGKTSIASMLYDLYVRMGFMVGLISTIEIKIGDRHIDSSLTTPDALGLQRSFYQMAKKNVSHVFMEVSSHALDQGRTDMVDFDLAIFSNLSHDHLDYHETFSAYLKAKKLLFDNLKKEAAALVNIDDPNGKVMLQNCSAREYTFALNRMADFKAKVLANDLSGLQLILDDKELYLKVIGKFNAYNALAVYGACMIMGLDKNEVLRHLSSIDSAEGRMDVVSGEKAEYKAIVDYAHTPDALEKVLMTLTEVINKKSKLITVIGCGGNRDKKKRPLMAKIAAGRSDVVILTSDNPRNEDPDAIIDDMYAGINEKTHATVLRNKDRAEAIKTACAMAQKGDIVLVAGKGHEKYQEIKGQRFPFDDKQILDALMHIE